MAELLASFATFTLFVVMLPGFVAQALVRALTTHARQDAFFFTVYALMWGIASYALYGACIAAGTSLTAAFDLPTIVHVRWSFGQILSTESATSLTFFEVASVTAFGSAIGLAGAFAINRRFFHRVARRARITKQSGDISIWSSIFNDPALGEANVWVRAYPPGSEVWYDGWAQRYSDWTETHELFLRDVLIYRRDSGEELARVPAMYLKLPEDAVVVVDFPAFEETEHMRRYEPTVVAEPAE